MVVHHEIAITFVVALGLHVTLFSLGLILDEARKVADGLPGPLAGEILGLCGKIESEQGRLTEAIRRGEAGSPQAASLARRLGNNGASLANCIQSAGDRNVIDVMAGSLSHGSFLAPASHASVDQSRITCLAFVGT